MACFWRNTNETAISITDTEEIGTVTFYKITVQVGKIIWNVSHRYSEFYDLHSQLVTEHGVSRDTLPPKKVIRNKCPIFIETRRKALETYLQNVLNYLRRTMPRVFLAFLNFHLYDIYFLLQSLSSKFFNEGDSLLSISKSYTFNPLELHAISECLKKPVQHVEENESKYDFSHVLDFCGQLNSLIINGSCNKFGDSNIIPNLLPFELSSFKVMKMVGVKLEKIYSVENLRTSVKTLYIYKTASTNLSQILQCDIIHKNVVQDTQVWTSVVEVDLSSNNITEIDDSIKLVPNCKVLALNHNKISSITNLTHLPALTHLSVSDNLITCCDRLHVKLGNIVSLDFSQNGIESLEGFSKLYSLETLNVSCNKIADIEEVAHVGELPCLENLILTGNIVTTIVDYRFKAFEHFGDRAKDICLDNEKASQQELDKVSILRALRIAKEGKTNTFNFNVSFG